MNAALLLEHYAQIAEAPDAIARMRRFILDLAVRGKLVEQDPDDEPASELLQRIKANVQHDQKRRGKTRNTSASNALEETPFEVPLGWTFASLGELVRVLNGRAYKQQELLEKGVPVLRVGNLFTSNHWYYSDLTLDDDKHCEAGDLIYAWSASFGPFIWNGPRVIYHYHIWKLPLVSEADLDKHYLYNFLLQKTREIKDAGHGVSMVHMTKEKMEKLLVPLPPLTEQRRIVAKVDELMALSDQLEATRAERETGRRKLTLSTLAKLNEPDPETFANDASFVIEHLEPLTKRTDQIKQLRQTILNLAVRGKLVEQHPNDEPVYGNSIEHAEGALFAIPASWRWRSLRSLGTLKGGGTPAKSRDDFWNGSIPWVSPKDMKVDYIACAQMAITDAAVSGSAVSILDAGSIMFVVRGMILAHSFPVAISTVPLTINQDMKALMPEVPEMAEFLLRALKGLKPEMLKRVQRSSHGTCRLEGSDYADFPVPIPPLAEQRRIVAKVDELMALCDQLEASLTEGEQTRSKLLEAVLHEALEPA